MCALSTFKHKFIWWLIIHLLQTRLFFLKSFSINAIFSHSSISHYLDGVNSITKRHILWTLLSWWLHLIRVLLFCQFNSQKSVISTKGRGKNFLLLEQRKLVFILRKEKAIAILILEASVLTYLNVKMINLRTLVQTIPALLIKVWIAHLFCLKMFLICFCFTVDFNHQKFSL